MKKNTKRKKCLKHVVKTRNISSYDMRNWIASGDAGVGSEN